MEFPSPCGVNIVANFGDLEAYEFELGVSVPLRGKYRSEWNNSGGDRLEMVAFPSPCGVNIVANYSPKILHFALNWLTFPSPCGVNIVANCEMAIANIKLEGWGVSVPLRGKYRSE